jgi:hypothetical protein
MQGVCLVREKKKSELRRSLECSPIQWGQYLSGMMHEVMWGTKGRKVRVTLLKSLKVITNLSNSFPSLTPIIYLYLRTNLKGFESS